jgi:hypothetical protein
LRIDGSAMRAQAHSVEKLWADHFEVVPQFTTPEQAADLVGSGEWRRVRERQREWYADHYSEARLRERAARSIEHLSTSTKNGRPRFAIMSAFGSFV